MPKHKKKKKVKGHPSKVPHKGSQSQQIESVSSDMDDSDKDNQSEDNSDTNEDMDQMMGLDKASLKRKANSSSSTSEDDDQTKNTSVESGAKPKSNDKTKKLKKDTEPVVVPPQINLEAPNQNLSTSQSSKPNSSQLPTQRNGQPRASINIDNEIFLNSQPDIRKVHIVSVSERYKLTSLNPCYLGNAIHSCIGEFEEIQYLKPSGSLFINCKTHAQVKAMLKVNKLQYKPEIQIPVKVTIAKVSQTVQGKITAPEIADMSIPEVLMQLEPSGVIDVRKMFNTPDKKDIPIYILTFFGSTCPTSIKFAYINYRVDRYYPRTKLCLKCCFYGHTKSTCRNKPVCHKCGSRKHLENECTENTLKCPNCKGNHRAFDKSCPVDQKEAQILKIKTQQNISFRDARQLVDDNERDDSEYIPQTQSTQIPTISFSNRAFPPLPKSRTHRYETQEIGENCNHNRETTPPPSSSIRQLDIIPETQTQTSREELSLPSLTPAVESSQRTQWFKPQRDRTFRRSNNSQNGFHSESEDELLQILEGNENKRRTPYQNQTTQSQQLNNTNYQQNDLKSLITDILVPIIPLIVKLMLAKDLTSKIEVVLEMAKCFNIQSIIEKTLSELEVSSRIDASQTQA